MHHIGNAAFEKKINQELKAYIEQSYQEYLKNKKAGEQQGFKTEYRTSFSVKYNAAGKLSIQTLNYIYSGGAHGLTSVQSFNYDLKAQKRVTLDQILNTKTKVSKTRDYLYSYIKKHDELFFPDVKKEDITLNKDTMFYFTANGIAIVFTSMTCTLCSGNPECAGASLYLSIIKEPYPKRIWLNVSTTQTVLTIAALNKDTAIPLTISFHTFLPMTVDFSPSRIELYVP